MPKINGHAPAHVRARFWEVVEDATLWGGEEFHRLTGELWNCSDVMPTDGREEVWECFNYAWADEPSEPYTYGGACRLMRRAIRDGWLTR